MLGYRIITTPEPPFAELTKVFAGARAVSPPLPVFEVALDGFDIPTLPPTEHPTLHPSNDSVMTTEGGSGHPYLQEQEKEKEKEQMQMQVEEQMDFSFIPDEISQYLKSKGL